MRRFFKIGDDKNIARIQFFFLLMQSWRYAVMTHCQLTKALSELWVDWSVWSLCYLMLLDWCFVVRWRASVQQITSGKERSMWSIFFIALPDFRLIACFTESKARNWPCGALCCSDLSTWGTKTVPHYDSEKKKKKVPVLLSIYHSDSAREGSRWTCFSSIRPRESWGESCFPAGGETLITNNAESLLTLCTLKLVCIFSLLFSLHFLKHWQGEFVKKLRAL